MSRYVYRAATREGQIRTGILGAASVAEADDRLLAQGLVPIALGPARAWRPGERRIPSRDLVAAVRSVATLVGVGVPVERALATTGRLPLAPPLRVALEDARRLLAEGRPLSVALTDGGVPLRAPELGLLRAGERGSRLGEALEALARALERREELRGRIRQALAYPAVLLLAGLASVGVIAGVIVPRFAEILADLGTALPPTTRLLLAASALVRAHGLVLVGALTALVVLAVRWAQSPRGAVQLSEALLRAPLAGPIRHGFAAARATQALGALLGTGAPMLTALAAAREASGEVTIAARLERTQGRVARGEGLAPALEAEGALPIAVLQLVAVGEGTGHLAAMSERAAELAAREAEATLRTLVSLIEPVLVLVIAGLVAFVALALLQAVYSLRPVA